jgi:hypothetical protein
VSGDVGFAKEKKWIFEAEKWIFESKKVD